MPATAVCCVQCTRPVDVEAPKPGDFHVCDGCGDVTCFDEGLELQPVPAEQLARLPWLKRLQFVIRHGSN